MPSCTRARAAKYSSHSGRRPNCAARRGSVTWSCALNHGAQTRETDLRIHFADGAPGLYHLLGRKLGDTLAQEPRGLVQHVGAVADVGPGPHAVVERTAACIDGEADVGGLRGLDVGDDLAVGRVLHWQLAPALGLDLAPIDPQAVRVAERGDRAHGGAAPAREAGRGDHGAAEQVRTAAHPGPYLLR